MMTEENAVDWSDDLDCLRFSVPGHGAPCAMHRLAFKVLINDALTEETCRAYFVANREAFLAAATNKIERLSMPFERSLHINSRKDRRASAVYWIVKSARVPRKIPTVRLRLPVPIDRGRSAPLSRS